MRWFMSNTELRNRLPSKATSADESALRQKVTERLTAEFTPYLRAGDELMVRWYDSPAADLMAQNGIASNPDRYAFFTILEMEAWDSATKEAQ
jgi:hypothetical protein